MNDHEVIVSFPGMVAVFEQPALFEIRWLPQHRWWEVRLGNLSVPGLVSGLRQFADEILLAIEGKFIPGDAVVAQDDTTDISIEISSEISSDDGHTIDVYAFAMFDSAQGFHGISSSGEPLYGADGLTGSYKEFWADNADRENFARSALELIDALDAHPNARSPYPLPDVKATLGDTTQLTLSTVDEQWWIWLSRPDIKKALPLDTVRELGKLLRTTSGSVLLLEELNYRMVATMNAGNLTVRITSPAPNGGEYELEISIGHINPEDFVALL